MVDKITSVFSKEETKESDLKKVINIYKKQQDAKKKIVFLDEKEKRLFEQREELLNLINSTNEELVKILDSKVLLSGNDFYMFIKDNFEKIITNDFNSFEKLFYNFISKKESKDYDTLLTEEFGEITSDGHIMICPDPDNCSIHAVNKKSLIRFKIKFVR